LKHELRSSRERILVIGKRCGFPNANYLKKLFLAETGMTMREWRRRNTQI
jgi:AraC-like DNA-binding protein